MDGGNLIADHLEHVVTPVTAVFLASVRRKPFRALPAEGLGVYAAARAQRFVQGARLAGPAGHLFFTGAPGGEGEAIIQKHLVAHIRLAVSYHHLTLPT